MSPAKHVRVLKGDLFSSSAQTLVNSVNCVGVMGKGIALQFREHFPTMYEDYVRRCERGELKLGEPYVFRQLTQPWVVNFPTKQHWRSVSDITDIIRGVEYLKAHYREWGITSLAVPSLGAGLGQLDWKIIGRTLYRHLSRLEIPVELYAPADTPPAQLTMAFLEDRAVETKLTGGDWKSAMVSDGLLVLVEVVRQLDRQPYRWPMGRVLFQKLAYFGTALGLPTDLRFQRASFGPFDPLLKKRVTVMVSNGLLREKQIGRMFAIRPGATFDDVRETKLALFSRFDEEIHRLQDLFMRLDTDRGEVAATVHFAAAHLLEHLRRRATELEVVREVMEWKRRRRPSLDERIVGEATRALAVLGWLDVQASSELALADGLL